VQLGHGIGRVLTAYFRAVKPLFIRNVLAVGRETPHRGIQILAKIGTKQPDMKVKDIVADRLTESAPRLVSKLKVRGRKRKLDNISPKLSPSMKSKKKATKAKVAGAQKKETLKLGPIKEGMFF
jgi:hypothetical protein